VRQLPVFELEMNSSGSGFARAEMSLRAHRSTGHLDSRHGHLVVVSRSVEGVEVRYVAEDNLGLDVGLAESIRLAEDSFAGCGHEVDIRHGRAIVAATSCEWVICFPLDNDENNIFSNRRTHDNFHEAMALRIHHDVVDNPVVPKRRSGCRLAVACLTAGSRGCLGYTCLDLSSLAGVSAFEAVTRNVSENVRDEERGRVQVVRCVCLWDLLL